MDMCLPTIFGPTPHIFGLVQVLDLTAFTNSAGGQITVRWPRFGSKKSESQAGLKAIQSQRLQVPI